MASLLFCLVDTVPGSGLIEAWRRHPEGVYALAFGGAMLLLVLLIRLRDYPARRRAKKLGGALDCTQLEELMLGNPPQIVDLRPEAAYRGPKGHLRGALNIPFPELAKRLGELDTSHPRPIVLVDETDPLAYQAADLLKAHGHPWVYVLSGGLKAWRRARLPLYHALGQPVR
ncbi:MAG: molybdopterin biosynthesis protein MoeB [Acidobacteria bacterium ADurb.Bin340]|nr:MAG: molybdopterin biosynthesis protein MoeB [Acidobacteria bacterium ADurb.Bin340]HOD32845.1 rhodanese-like domain-containing protein [Holophaga sp.]HQL47685.1 rhodanese-like domain-containing protein [Holophaga sp.]